VTAGDTAAAVSSGPLEKVLSDELESGLKITPVDEAGDLYARVSWIHRDSGFRGSGLAVEDRIEEKWNGVFKGAFAPKTIDELVDSTSRRVNAETPAAQEPD
jgi:hypothetical protein